MPSPPRAQVWPIELALAMRLAGRSPPGSAAELLLRAAVPWSAESHPLWPPAARAHALALVRIGHAIAWGHASVGELTQPAALVDVWRTAVMPLALRRSYDGR